MNFKELKCDADELSKDLNSAPWHVSDIFQCMDDQWSYWKMLFFEIVDKYANKVVKIRAKRDKAD